MCGSATRQGAAALRRPGRGAAALRAAIARNADRHALDLAPVVEDIRAGGATSLRAIADELNARGMLTRRGGRWHVSTVSNLLDRLGVGEVKRGHSMIEPGNSPPAVPFFKCPCACVSPGAGF